MKKHLRDVELKEKKAKEDEGRNREYMVIVAQQAAAHRDEISRITSKVNEQEIEFQAYLQGSFLAKRLSLMAYEQHKYDTQNSFDKTHLRTYTGLFRQEIEQLLYEFNRFKWHTTVQYEDVCLQTRDKLVAEAVQKRKRTLARVKGTESEKYFSPDVYVPPLAEHK